MTRLQTGLLIVLGLLTAVVLAQADWFSFLPIAAAALAAVAGWIGQAFTWLTSIPMTVPTWIWWVVFGILFSRWWGRAAHFRGGCCASRRRHWKAASEAA